jgi:hypothetical protein
MREAGATVVGRYSIGSRESTRIAFSAKSEVPFSLIFLSAILTLAFMQC